MKHCLLVVCLVSFGGTPLAADPKVDWTLVQPAVFPTQAQVLTLTVEGSAAVILPDLVLPGVRVELLNAGEVSVYSGNDTLPGYQASWRLRARQPGPYQLPVAALTVSGRPLPLPRLAWNVKAPTAGTGQLVQTLSHPVLVPGLEFDYTLTWFNDGLATDLEPDLPLLDSPDLELVDNPVPAGAKVFPLSYGGRSLKAATVRQTVAGQSRLVLTLALRLKALHPTTIDLSPTSLSYLQVGRPQADLAQSVALEVVDLPAAGRPAAFSGLVGQLDFSWSVGDSYPAVGQPVPLTLHLTGSYGQEDLDWDAILAAALEGSVFTVGQGRPDGQGGRLFELRVGQSGPQVLPALALNYFDPVQRVYRVTQTQPIHFEVAGPAGNPAPSPPVPTLGSAGPAGWPQPLPVPKAVWSWEAALWWLPLPGLVALGLGWGLSSARWQRLRQQRRWRRWLAAGPTDTGLPGLEQGRQKLRAVVEGQVPALDPLPVAALTIISAELNQWEAARFQKGGLSWQPAERWQVLQGKWRRLW